MVLVVGAGSVAAQSTGQDPNGGTILTGHFGETWTGSNTTQGLFVQNGGTGMGIYGYSKGVNYNKAGIVGLNASTGSGVYGRALGGGSAVYGLGDLGYGVFGKGTDGGHFIGTKAGFSGVYGEHANGWGTYGVSKAGFYSGAFGVGYDGVRGTTTTSNGYGVWGYTNTNNAYGVTGASTNYFGMLAAGNDASYNDQLGDLYLAGNFGEIFAVGNTLDLTSNGNIWMDLDNNNEADDNNFSIWNGNNVAIWWVYESGKVVSTGSQATAVQTTDQGQRLMYSIQGTGVWLEDVGTAALVNGELFVPFDSVYAQAANLSANYQVFVTATCDQPVLLYVSAKTATGFTVKGANLDGSPSGCAFDYRVVAERAGYEGVRTEQYTTEQRQTSGVDTTTEEINPRDPLAFP